MSKSKKTLTNINTIFEKSRRGELDVAEGGYSFRSKFNIEFNKRSELVKPYLHYIDDKSLNRSVERYVINPASHSEVVALAKKYNKNLKSGDTLAQEMSDLWKRFPKEIVSDIFSMYYNNTESLEFADRTDKNKFRYQMLEKSADPVTKIMSKESNVKSMVFTRGLVQYFLTMMATLQQEDPDKFEQMMKQMGGGDGDEEGEQEGEGSGSGDASDKDGKEGKDKQDHKSDPNAGGDEKDSKSSNGPSNGSGNGDTKGKSPSQLAKDLAQRFDEHQSSKAILNKIMDDAKQTVKDMDKLMSKEELDNLWKDVGNRDIRTSTKALNQTDKKYLEKIETELRKVSLNLSNIKQKIKSLLDKSVSYFSSREIVQFENIFEADTLDGLQDYELLHPKLRKIFLEDILVKDIKRLGKIDIYIDVSGSMSSSSGVKDIDGRNMSKELFSKAFAYKMKEMNLLNEVYSFESTVKYEGNSLFDILNVGGGGGTCIDNVVRSIQKNKKNAIVLTDAEDYCSLYSENAFFIGVQGARFSSFQQNILREYQAKNQLTVFDGKRVYNVDSAGYQIG
jgi:hypothetical protein